MDESGRTVDEAATGTVWPTLASAAVLVAIAALFGFGAGRSPDNCGELPGITRAATTFFGYVLAGAVFLVGLVASALRRRAAWLGRAAVLAIAIVVGVELGATIAGPPPCDGDGRPNPQPPGPTAVMLRIPPAEAG